MVFLPSMARSARDFLAVGELIAAQARVARIMLFSQSMEKTMLPWGPMIDPSTLPVDPAVRSAVKFTPCLAECIRHALELRLRYPSHMRSH